MLDLVYRTQLADILPSLQSSHPDVQLHQTASPEGFPVLEVSCKQSPQTLATSHYNQIYYRSQLETHLESLLGYLDSV